MFGDLKNKLKRNSIRSVKSLQQKDVGQTLKVSASTPVLSTAVPPQPPAHNMASSSSTQLSRKQQEKAPVSRRTSPNSTFSHTNKPASSHTSEEEEEEQFSGNNSTASSSSASISMPRTPPIQHYRHASNVSLPASVSNEFFLNHNHLKPGDHAELLSYNKTINMYRENAKRTNDPTIQCDLAIYLYESSKNSGGEKGAYINEAMKMLKALSSRGHGESQYYLANIYASGQLHNKQKPDFGNAFPLFAQAAKHQHADAAYRAAKCYEDGLGCLKNKSKAVQYYKLAAKLSHPGAMYRLGLANIQGSLGLTRNVRDGNKWLKRSSDAASPEYPHALHELGLLHEKGLEGIIFKDGQYSVQLYTRAASELGYAPSAYRLGECFEFGYLGCEKDTTSAVFYYLIAAKQGNADACFALSALYLTGDETKNIKPSEEKAFYWASVAAEKGIAKAEFAMGYFTEVGIGRTVNIQEAANWYQKAASQGDEKAKKRLSNLRSRPTPTYNKIPPSNSTTMVAATGEA